MLSSIPLSNFMHSANLHLNWITIVHILDEFDATFNVFLLQNTSSIPPHFQFGEKFGIVYFLQFQKIQHQIAMPNKQFGVNNFWQFSYS